MKRGVVTAAVVMGVVLTAIDTSIMGVAMPKVASELGGLALYSWVFSVYVLTSTTALPVFGKLADVWGRRAIFVICASIFMIGSALCAGSSSMPALIAFRAVQGLGGGGLYPLGMTIIGDIYAIDQRAKIEAVLSSAWGVTAVAAVLLGGLIVDHASWRWIFVINLPVGAVAIALVWIGLKETIEARKARIDVAGPLLLTLATAALLMALGRSEGQDPLVLLGTPLGTFALIAISIALTVGFVFVERHADDPMVPLRLLRRPIIAIPCIGNFLAGGALLGFASYVPLFVQAAMGHSATVSGLALTPASVGWPIGAYFSARLISKAGFKRLALAGAAGAALGTTALLGSARYQTLIGIGASMFVVGLGVGSATTIFIIAAQNAVDWAQRGIATALLEFSNTLGASIWVAIMGAAAGAVIGQARTTSSINPDVMAHGVERVFLIALGLGIAGMIVMMFFPRGRQNLAA
ncbi:MAG TPA: MFS transporter [Candidatus Binataceae bacterium]